MVDFLTEKTFFNDMIIKLLFGLQKQGAGTAGRVIDFIDARLLMYSQLSNQLGNMLGVKNSPPDLPALAA